MPYAAAVQLILLLLAALIGVDVLFIACCSELRRQRGSGFSVIPSRIDAQPPRVRSGNALYDRAHHPRDGERRQHQREEQAERRGRDVGHADRAEQPRPAVNHRAEHAAQDSTAATEAGGRA